MSGSAFVSSILENWFHTACSALMLLVVILENRPHATADKNTNRLNPCNAYDLDKKLYVALLKLLDNAFPLGGPMCSRWMLHDRGWLSLRTWTGSGPSGATTGWRISPRWDMLKTPPLYLVHTCRLRCTTLKKILGPLWRAWNPTKVELELEWFPWFKKKPCCLFLVHL